MSEALRRLSGDADHPADAETVREHAETRRPECLGQRHLYLPTLSESGKDSIGFSFIGYREGQRKPLESGCAFTLPVAKAATQFQAGETVFELIADTSSLIHHAELNPTKEKQKIVACPHRLTFLTPLILSINPRPGLLC